MQFQFEAFDRGTRTGDRRMRENRFEKFPFSSSLESDVYHLVGPSLAAPRRGNHNKRNQTCQVVAAVLLRSSFLSCLVPPVAAATPRHSVRSATLKLKRTNIKLRKALLMTKSAMTFGVRCVAYLTFFSVSLSSHFRAVRELVRNRFQRFSRRTHQVENATRSGCSFSQSVNSHLLALPLTCLSDEFLSRLGIL